MKKPVLSVLRYGFAFFLAVIVIVAWHKSVNAARDGSEGDQWMKWDNNVRQVYVGAYVQGAMSGFTRGCDQGVSAARPKTSGDAVLKYMSECLSHSLISERDSIKMVDTITEFYTRYPDQRVLNISDILLNLHAGSSIEQIHRRLAGTHK